MVQGYNKELNPLLRSLFNRGPDINSPISRAGIIEARGTAERANLDKDLLMQKLKMGSGEALTLGSVPTSLLNPIAGGAMAGAGNAMIRNEDIGNILGQAGIGGAAGGILSKVFSPNNVQGAAKVLKVSPNDRGVVATSKGLKGGGAGIQRLKDAQAQIDPISGATIPTPTHLEMTNIPPVGSGTSKQVFSVADETFANKFGFGRGSSAVPTQATDSSIGQRLPYPGQGGGVQSAINLGIPGRVAQNTQKMLPMVQQEGPGANIGGIMKNISNQVPDEAITGFMSSLSKNLGGQSGPLGSTGPLQNLLNAENIVGGAGFNKFMNFANKGNPAIDESLKKFMGMF